MISKVNELCDVIRWVAVRSTKTTRDREFYCVRVMLAKNMSFLALYWPTLFAIKQDKSTLSDKNISSDWESKEWRNLEHSSLIIKYCISIYLVALEFLNTKILLPFVLAQSALRVVILIIVYSHENYYYYYY